MTRAELLTKAKPILFNTEMVRAILDGRKTVTRRAIKPRYRDDEIGFSIITNAVDGSFNRVVKYDEWEDDFDNKGNERIVNPPYNVGNILYVRETWVPMTDYTPCGRIINTYAYKADDEKYFHGITMNVPVTGWHPSIHMPKEAARIFLRVTGVRVERLQDVTIQDLKNEGALYGCYECAHSNDYCGEAATLTQDCRYNSMSGYIYQEKEFELLWDSTIPKKNRELYGWDANPWVWVIEFERVEVQE